MKTYTLNCKHCDEAWTFDTLEKAQQKAAEFIKSDLQEFNENTTDDYYIYDNEYNYYPL